MQRDLKTGVYMDMMDANTSLLRDLKLHGLGI